MVRFKIVSVKLGARAYLKDSVIDRVAADLETRDVFVLTPKELIEKYSLAETLKDC